MTRSKTPNILFIMTDQQHDGMMSCTGNQWLETPAMDALAQDGVRFENAYCTNPVCAPSRIGMMTGMMPCRLGADDNAMSSALEGLPKEISANSMGNLMKPAGYDTFYGGKVHLCKDINPLEAGYDEFFPNDREELPGGCLEFLTRDRDKPFFAVASFINPHDICFAHLAKNGKDRHDVLHLREQAMALPAEELPPLPDNYAITENEPTAIKNNLNPTAFTPAIVMRDEYDDYEWRINRWIYHRLTEQVDTLIGEILDGLKDAGLYDDTLILFTSDHGNMDASHRLASKMLPYEESAGVPFIMSWPKGISSGRTDTGTLVSSGLDILPTFCDYAGTDIPSHFLGQSLRPVLEGSALAKPRSFVPSESEWFRMIRTERYKYCCFADEDSKELLIDLQNDPGELTNLCDDPTCVDVLNSHRLMMSEWMNESGDEKGKRFL